MDAIQRELVQALEQNAPAAIATVVKTIGSTPRAIGAKMLIYADGRTVGSVGGGDVELCVIEAALEVIRAGKPRYLDFTHAHVEHGERTECANAMDIFVEPLSITPTLVIAGAGHVGAACAELGKFLGFHVIVIDDRPSFLSREKFPTADELRAGDLVTELKRTDLTAQSYVVLVTRAHALDGELLRAVLDSPAPYIGLLGNDRRAASVMQRLREQGISEQDIQRVHSPVGIEIEAETPQEIAVSILAQIIETRRREDVKS